MSDAVDATSETVGCVTSPLVAFKKDAGAVEERKGRLDLEYSNASPRSAHTVLVDDRRALLEGETSHLLEGTDVRGTECADVEQCPTMVTLDSLPMLPTPN